MSILVTSHQSAHCSIPLSAATFFTFYYGSHSASSPTASERRPANVGSFTPLLLPVKTWPPTPKSKRRAAALKRPSPALSAWLGHHLFIPTRALFPSDRITMPREPRDATNASHSLLPRPSPARRRTQCAYRGRTSQPLQARCLNTICMFVAFVAAYLANLGNQEGGERYAVTQCLWQIPPCPRALAT